MKNAFQFQPQINGSYSTEPSLWDIVYMYYAPHFSNSEAIRLTNEYIDAIVASIKG